MRSRHEGFTHTTVIGLGVLFWFCWYDVLKLDLGKIFVNFLLLNEMLCPLLTNLSMTRAQNRNYTFIVQVDSGSTYTNWEIKMLGYIFFLKCKIDWFFVMAVVRCCEAIGWMWQLKAQWRSNYFAWKVFIICLERAQLIRQTI